MPFGSVRRRWAGFDRCRATQASWVPGVTWVPGVICSGVPTPKDDCRGCLPAGSIAAIQDDAAAVDTYVVATDKRGRKCCGARFQCRKRSCFDRDELIPEGHSIR